MRVLHGDGLQVGRRYFPWIRRSACLSAERREGIERALCSREKGRLVPSLQRKGFCLPEESRPLHFSSPASGAGSEQLLLHLVPPGPVARTCRAQPSLRTGGARGCPSALPTVCPLLSDIAASGCVPSSSRWCSCTSSRQILLLRVRDSSARSPKSDICKFSLAVLLLAM